MGSVGAILSFLKAARSSLRDPSARLLPVVFFWGPEGRHLRLFGVLKDDWGRSIDARGGAQEIIWPKWL